MLHVQARDNASLLSSRRQFLRASAASGLALSGLAPGALRGAARRGEPFFQTRGVVITPSDITTWDWPQQAKRAGLSAIGTHIFPHQVAAFVNTDDGQRFLGQCRRLGLEVEHELHSMRDLLPRELFEKNPTMFRMNEKGDRTPDYNLCVHSSPAVELMCENAEKYARLLRPTTGRYFYWIDDARPMCHCPKCREYSDSDQALLLENHIFKTLRRADPRATLAHLAYANTYKAPTAVKPEKGVFLEFAPIHRNYDAPLRQRDSRFGNYLHGELLDHLDANLEVFGSEGAQALEYWLDESRFLRHLKPPRPLRVKIPWRRAVFREDLDIYGKRGVRHITTFAVQIDGDYIKLFGSPPLDQYGDDLANWPHVRG